MVKRLQVKKVTELAGVVGGIAMDDDVGFGGC